jgi:hypothetical protein
VPHPGICLPWVIMPSAMQLASMNLFMYFTFKYLAAFAVTKLKFVSVHFQGS